MLLMQFTAFQFSVSSGKSVHISHEIASEGVCDTPSHAILTDIHKCALATLQRRENGKCFIQEIIHRGNASKLCIHFL